MVLNYIYRLFSHPTIKQQIDSLNDFSNKEWELIEAKPPYTYGKLFINKRTKIEIFCYYAYNDTNIGKIKNGNINCSPYLNFAEQLLIIKAVNSRFKKVKKEEHKAYIYKTRQCLNK